MVDTSWSRQETYHKNLAEIHTRIARGNGDTLCLPTIVEDTKYSNVDFQVVDTNLHVRKSEQTHSLDIHLQMARGVCDTLRLQLQYRRPDIQF